MNTWKDISDRTNEIMYKKGLVHAWHLLVLSNSPLLAFVSPRKYLLTFPSKPLSPLDDDDRKWFCYKLTF